MRAALLTIGDELLIGQTINTNAAWLGERLDALGAEVVRTLTVGDDVEAVSAALEETYRHAELVVMTGGLGPTHDDVTKHAVARFFNAELRFDEAVYEGLRARFARRGRTVSESNRSIAYVPEGFEPLSNPVGSAPGLWHAGADARRIAVVLPGVPSEMKAVFDQEVTPRLHTRGGLRAVVHRVLRTSGIGESALHERLGALDDLLGEGLTLAFLPDPTGVRLRLTGRAGSEHAASERIDRLEARLRERAGAYVYGTGDDELEAVLGRVLAERGLRLAVAESCTGGLVASRLTDVSGSSAYFIGGVVAYDNAVKTGVLGIDPEVLAREGAVSEAVARQMARGVRKRLGADIGLSATGVAGPTGGTPDKPVGTVWVGYADAEGDTALRLQFASDRLLNKALSATAVLNLLWRRLSTDPA